MTDSDRSPVRARSALRSTIDVRTGDSNPPLSESFDTVESRREWRCWSDEEVVKVEKSRRGSIPEISSDSSWEQLWKSPLS